MPRNDFINVDGTINYDNIESVQDFNAHLADNATSVTKYKNLVVGNNWSPAINATIDEVFALGGGDVLLPPGNHSFATSILLKENVRLVGSKNSNLAYTSLNGSLIIFYKRSSIKDINFTIIDGYNDHALLFSSDYIEDNLITIDKSSGSKIFAENIWIFSTCTGDKANKSAIHFMSNDKGGLWNIKCKNMYLRGFDTIVTMETVGTGWINGNLLEDITCEDFVNVTKVTRSLTDQGVYYNIFKHLVIQTGTLSQDFFLDYTSNNIYTELEVYDMQLYPNARIGYARVSYYMKGNDTQLKEKISNIFYTGSYMLLGKFIKNPISNSLYAIFSFKGGSLNVDTEISVNGDFQIDRKHKGTVFLDNTQVKFYKKVLADGSVELYCNTNYSYDISIFIEATNGFSISLPLLFTAVTGLVELTNNIEHYIYSSTLTNANFEAKIITESGTNVNGKYIKYGDGTLICSGEVSISATASTPITSDWIFPYNFITTDIHSRSYANIESVSNTWSFTVGICTCAYVDGTKTTIHFQASLTQNYIVNFFAIGRWK